MRRGLCWVLIAGMLGIAPMLQGCSSSDASADGAGVVEDTRPKEIRETDDMMQKALQKKTSSRKAR